MFSYQHIYHAGSWADVHKHAILCAVWNIMAQKPTPLTYVESHSGRGLYNLNAAEAKKTAEYTTGIMPLRKQLEKLPPVFEPYIKALETYKPGYPGSPACIAANAREGDKLLLCEKHPQELAQLKRVTYKLHGAIAMDRDGHEALPKLAPPHTKRGLMLIDPSYEIKTEYAQVAETVKQVLAKWPSAPILVWYPILKDQNYHLTLLDGLKKEIEKHSYFQCIIKNPHPVERGMIESGMLMLNAPLGAKSKADEITAALSTIFAPSKPA